MAKAKDVELKRGKSYFNLVGTAKVNDYTFALDKESSSSSYIYSRMNLGIDCGNSNIVYAEMMGGFRPDGSSEVFAHGKSADGKKEDFENRLVYSWDERLNESNYPEIGESCFIKVGVEKDVKGKTVVRKFLSAYDAIEYVAENLKTDTVVSVSGQIKYSVYEGETQTKKEVQSIYLSSAKPEEFKATFSQTYLLTKDSFGKVDPDKNSITMYGYVPEYFGKIDGKEVKKMLLLPKSFEFDLSKHSGEVIKKLTQNFLKFKPGYFLEIGVDGEFREGVSTQSVTLDDLNPELRLLIDIGVMTEEDALTKAAINGNREKRMIFSTPHIIKTTIKNDDGSESITQTVDINPEKYPIDSVKMYSDYANVEEDAIDEEDLSDSGMALTDESLDFLKDLV